MAIEEVDETTRLARLDELHIVFSPAEERFDRITRIAKALFHVPIALVSLVARDILWFKSKVGCVLDGCPRQMTFCTEAIRHDVPLIITDAKNDPQYCTSPLVTGPPHIRFYAGIPINYRGANIGTFCIIDSEPREMSQADMEMLRTLTDWVESELNIWMLSTGQGLVLSTLTEADRSHLIDADTTCWNRVGLDRVLTKELAQREYKGIPAAVVYFSMTNYPALVEAKDKQTADTLALMLSQQIRAHYPQDAILARIADNEFLLVHTLINRKQMENCHRSLRDMARQSEDKKSRQHTGVSVTTSTVFTEIETASELESVLMRARGQAQTSTDSSRFTLFLST